MPAKVNPLTLEKWTPADDETLQSVMAGKLPDVFRGSQPKPQPVPTPAAQWTAMAAHISAILDQTQDKRRFILHYPQQAPFQVAVMFDIAEPVKKCPAGVGDEGAPLMIARYRKHDPGWAPDEAKEAVVDFLPSLDRLRGRLRKRWRHSLLGRRSPHDFGKGNLSDTLILAT